MLHRLCFVIFLFRNEVLCFSLIRLLFVFADPFQVTLILSPTISSILCFLPRFLAQLYSDCVVDPQLKVLTYTCDWRESTARVPNFCQLEWSPFLFIYPLASCTYLTVYIIDREVVILSSFKHLVIKWVFTISWSALRLCSWAHWWWTHTVLFSGCWVLRSPSFQLTISIFRTVWPLLPRYYLMSIQWWNIFAIGHWGRYFAACRRE